MVAIIFTYIDKQQVINANLSILKMYGFLATIKPKFLIAY